MLELTVEGEDGAPTRIAIDTGRLKKEEVSQILRPLVHYLYGQYKRSLYEASVAASTSYNLLEEEEELEVSDNPTL